MNPHRSRTPLTRRTVASLAITATLGLGLTACGGDSTDTLSRSELATKADAICATAQTASRKIPVPTESSDPVSMAAYFDQLAPVVQRQADGFHDLKPDAEAKTDWNQLVARQDQAKALLESIRDKAHAKDPSGEQDLAKALRIDEKFTAEATTIGADTCATD